jgi:Mrp family chromosome partitioning ATPase
VESAPGFERLLAQLQSSAQGMSRAPVLGIAACRSGDGATFVTNALARQLTTKSRKRVLQADFRDLFLASGCTATELMSQCVFTDQQGRWRLSAPRGMRVLHDLVPEGDLRRALATLESQFDFLVVDCAAVTTSGWLWPLAPFLDEVLLVVAAGETRRQQVHYAQQLIEEAGARLSGCVLNKRTYPLPEAVYRLLS